MQIVPKASPNQRKSIIQSDKQTCDAIYDLDGYAEKENEDMSDDGEYTAYKEQ